MNTSLGADTPPDLDAILRLVLEHVPDALLLRSSGSELVRCNLLNRTSCSGQHMQGLALCCCHVW